LKGKQPTLSKAQRTLLFDLQDTGGCTQTEIGELFSVSRATVYREIKRRRVSVFASYQAHIF
jgi:IS30 family transposase